MKKYKKLTRIISLVFALCMLMSVTGLAAEVDEVAVIMERQSPALDAYQNIWNSFETDENGDKIWPEEFAGEYVDKNQDYKLVIRLTDISEKMQEKYKSLSGNAECLLFEKANYSLSYLESLTGNLKSLSESGYTVLWWVASHRTSTLRVVVDEKDVISTNEIDEINSKNVKKNLPIVVETGRAAVAAASLVGGSGIYNVSSGGNISIGIGGSYTSGSVTYDDCILTCGHLNPVGSTVRYNGTNTGVVVYRSYSNSPSNYALGDYAIVRILDASGYTSSNDVKISSGTVNITGSYLTVPIGTVVYKYGASSGYAKGEVVETGISDFEYSEGGTLVESGTHAYARGITQLSFRDGTAAGGDSGGPMYVRRSNGEYWMYGVLTAVGPQYDDPGSTTNYMYMTPVARVPSGFTIRTT